MYEENTAPLPTGDAALVFAQQLAEMAGGQSFHPDAVTPETVVRYEDTANQERFAAICRRLLLPGSRLRGVTNLRALVDLAHKVTLV